MSKDTVPKYSEFSPLQGLWTPRSLDHCAEILDYLRSLSEIPVGILFLCFAGMRNLESWFAEGMCRPKLTCTVLALDQPLAHVNGADLVAEVTAFEKESATVSGWIQLYAATLWSELRGAEVSCLWTNQALRVLQSSNTEEALFFPWSSPVWQHGLSSSENGGVEFDPYEMALCRGLNPLLIRGFTKDDCHRPQMNASHFYCARTAFSNSKKVAPISSAGTAKWRLDRYFTPEATGSTLGVAFETRRFRANLFKWMANTNCNSEQNLLIADALLHLRNNNICTAVSCNSFLFRWRTRNPFLYQYLNLGELHQVLSLLCMKKEKSFDRSLHERSKKSAIAEKIIPTEGKHSIQINQFEVDMGDNQIASGMIFKIKAITIGQGVYPDVVMSDTLKPLSAIVEDYEKATGTRVIVAINGGYFLDTRTVPKDHPSWLGMPVGLLKCNEKVISGPFYKNRPVFCLDDENRISLRFISNGICTQDRAPLADAYKWSDVNDEYVGFRAAIEAGPLLIKGGTLDLDLDREQWGTVSARSIQAAPVEMSDLRTQRAAIVMSLCGDLRLVTVHGRIPESVGMTHEELASWIHDEVPDVDWAMEMDAGGSVTAWHVDLGVTTVGSCFGGRERPIATAIVFSTGKGSAHE